MLVALDPSVTRCGLAVFDGRGLLVSAHAVTVPKNEPVRSYADRAIRMAHECLRTLPGMTRHADLACEWPQIYSGAKSKGDQNPLLLLSGVCTALGVMLGGDFHSYLPADWVGQVPKIETVKGCKTSPRARKIKARLSAAELVIWDTETKYHDTIDAIGIGLHHLGRFDRKRVWGR